MLLQAPLVGNGACRTLAYHEREEELSRNDKERKNDKAERESTETSSQYPKRNASPTSCSAVRAALFQAAWLTAGLAC